MAIWENPETQPTHVMGYWPGQLGFETYPYNEQLQIDREKIAFASLTQSPVKAGAHLSFKKKAFSWPDWAGSEAASENRSWIRAVYCICLNFI